MRRLVLIIIGLLALGTLALHEYMLLPDGRLHIYFMNVRQGDSALIVTPSGKQIIIDGGPADGAMLAELSRHMPFFDRSIDLLILTHPQLDHIYAFPDILRRYKVGRVLMTGIDYDLPRYREFLSLIREQRVPVSIADPKRDLDMGDGVMLDILWPPPVPLGMKIKDINNASLVLKLIDRSGTGSVLFTGDMEEKEERELIASGADLRATVLKVGHHGSKTSSGTGFLLAVRPRLAAISSDDGSKYGHPHKVILDRFKHLGIPVRVTGWEGTVEIIF